MKYLSFKRKSFVFQVYYKNPMEMQKQSMGYMVSKMSSFGESWKLSIIFLLLLQEVQICETVFLCFDIYRSSSWFQIRTTVVCYAHRNS